jgi:outer membrane lipoprotein-sorting protein
MLPGGEAFKLELRLDGGAVRTDYIDVASRLLVRSDFTRVIRGRPVEVQSDFSDFREVDGLIFPHRIETRAKDRPETITIVIEEIELDPELDDDRFRLPE